MTNLQALVSSYQKKAVQTARVGLDGPKRKDRWLHELDKLNSFIRASLINAGVPKTQIADFDEPIQEETLGRYAARGLVARIGNEEIRFTPVGSVLIGAYGRVDVTGSNLRSTTVKLIADAPSLESDWTWLVYPGRTRAGGFPLDEEGLVKVLEAVMGSR